MKLTAILLLSLAAAAQTSDDVTQSPQIIPDVHPVDQILEPKEQKGDLGLPAVTAERRESGGGGAMETITNLLDELGVSGWGSGGSGWGSGGSGWGRSSGKGGKGGGKGKGSRSRGRGWSSGWGNSVPFIPMAIPVVAPPPSGWASPPSYPSAPSYPPPSYPAAPSYSPPSYSSDPSYSPPSYPSAPSYSPPSYPSYSPPSYPSDPSYSPPSYPSAPSYSSPSYPSPSYDASYARSYPPGPSAGTTSFGTSYGGLMFG